MHLQSLLLLIITLSQKIQDASKISNKMNLTKW